MTDEMNVSETSNSNAAFIFGALAGATVGAGLALLLAPRKGAETRDQLADAAVNFGRSMSKTSDEVMERGRELYGRARDIAARADVEFDRFTKAAQAAVNEG